MADVHEPPLFLILAGPNGAGKSTFASSGLPAIGTKPSDRSINVLNPDQIAAELSPSPSSARDIAAMRSVHKAVMRNIAQRMPFGIETAALTQSHYRFAQMARDNGFLVALIFVYLANVEVHIARVAQRVLLGGHDIPEKDVRRRFSSAIANFSMFAKFADRVLVFDNSALGDPQLSAEKLESRWHVFAPLTGAPESLRLAIEDLARSS